MEVKVDIEFNQILKLIQQLPDDKIKELSKKIQQQIQSKKSRSKKKLKKLILEAPSWSDEQLAEYQKARDHINSSTRLK